MTRSLAEDESRRPAPGDGGSRHHLAIAVAGLVWTIASGKHWLWQLPFVVVGIVPLWMMGELLYALSRPRVGYEAGELLVFLEPTRPTRLPIEIVEVFFFGARTERIAEAEGQGAGNAERDHPPGGVGGRLEAPRRAARVGHWCEGYITLRGSWCEPITPGADAAAESAPGRSAAGKAGVGGTGDRRRGRGRAAGSGRLALTELLVSVRNAAEARVALAGGADVVDVKEPRRAVRDLPIRRYGAISPLSWADEQPRALRSANCCTIAWNCWPERRTAFATRRSAWPAATRRADG